MVKWSFAVCMRSGGIAILLLLGFAAFWVKPATGSQSAAELAMADAPAFRAGSDSVLAMASVPDRHRALPAESHAADIRLAQLDTSDGQTVYETLSVGCVTCHGLLGTGSLNIFPGLVSPTRSKDQAITLVLRGGGGMTAYASSLTDKQIADVLTYVYNAFGNSEGAVSESRVEQLRTFDLDSLSASREENDGTAETAVNTVIATVALNNISRLGSNVVFSIETGGDGSSFGIGSSNGIINLAEATNFNYESKSEYTINIRATSSSDSSLMVEAEFVLSLTDLTSETSTGPVLPSQSDHTIFYRGSVFIDPVAAGGVTYSAVLSDGNSLNSQWLMLSIDANNNEVKLVDRTPPFQEPDGPLTTVTIDIEAVDSNSGMKSAKQRFELVRVSLGEEMDLVSSSNSQVTFRFPFAASSCGSAYDRIEFVFKNATGTSYASSFNTTGCASAETGSSSGYDWTVTPNSAMGFIDIKVERSAGVYSGSNGLLVGATFVKGSKQVASVIGTERPQPLRFVDATDPLVVTIDENAGSSTTPALTRLAKVRVKTSDSSLDVLYVVGNHDFPGMHRGASAFCVRDSESGTSCGSTSGILRTAEPLNFDHERKSSYTLTVWAYTMVPARKVTVQVSLQDGDSIRTTTRVETRRAYRDHEISKRVIINVADVDETAPAFVPDGGDLTLSIPFTLAVDDPVLTLTASSTGAVDWQIAEGHSQAPRYRVEDGASDTANQYLATVFLDQELAATEILAGGVGAHVLRISVSNGNAAADASARDVYLAYEAEATFDSLHKDVTLASGRPVSLLLSRALRYEYVEAERVTRERVMTRYSATLANGSALPDWLALGQDELGRWQLEASAPAVGTFNVKVNVLNDDDSVAVSDTFAITVEDVAGIGVDASSLSPLMPLSKTGVIMVTLLSQPDGSKNVTLTTSISGVNPAHIVLLPDNLVFTPSNWDTAQEITVSLTDAGAAWGGRRFLDIELTVHAAATSAPKYQNIAAKDDVIGGALGRARVAVVVPLCEKGQSESADGCVFKELPVQSDQVIFFGGKVAITPVPAAGVTYSARLSDGSPLIMQWLFIDPDTGEITDRTGLFPPPPLSKTVTIEIEATDTKTGKKTSKRSFELVRVSPASEISLSSSSNTQVTFRLPFAASSCSSAYDKIEFSFRNGSPLSTASTFETSGCASADTGSDSGYTWTVTPDASSSFIDIKVERTGGVYDGGSKVAVNGVFFKGTEPVGYFYGAEKSSPLQFLSSTDPVVVNINENVGSSTTPALTGLTSGPNDLRATSSNSREWLRYDVLSGDFPASEMPFCISSSGLGGELFCYSTPLFILRTAEAFNFDHERKSSYTLTVRVYGFIPESLRQTVTVTSALGPEGQTTVRVFKPQGELRTGNEISKRVIINVADVTETAPAFVPDGGDLTLSVPFTLAVDDPVLTLTASSAGATVDWGISEEEGQAMDYRIENGPSGTADEYLATVFLDRKNYYKTDEIIDLGLAGQKLRISASNGGSAADASFRDVRIVYELDPAFGDTHPDVLLAAGRPVSLRLSQASEYVNVAGKIQANLLTEYSATLANGSALPSWLTLERHALGYWLLVASDPVVGTFNVKVNALKGGTVLASDTFAITVEQVAGIGVGSNSLAAALTPASKTGVIMVSLLAQPAGGKNVTLTTSKAGVGGADPDHIVLLPDSLVFTPSNWETAQEITVSLTDAGATWGGIGRLVDIDLTVHAPSTSASNYGNIAGKDVFGGTVGRVRVKVSVPICQSGETEAADSCAANEAPVFDASSLTASIDENEAVSTSMAVGTLAATDADNETVTYSGAVGSSVFGVDAASGKVTVLADHSFNHEHRELYTIAVAATDGQEVVTGEFVLSVANVAEDPEFADEVLVDREIGRAAGGGFQIAATDPDGEVADGDIVHTAVVKGESALPAGVSIADDGTFTVAAGSAPLGDHVIVVTATETGNTNPRAGTGEFTLKIVQGGIDVDVSGLAALTPSAGEATIPVRLTRPPAAGNVVTLTLTSGNQGHLKIKPKTMKFGPRNWNTAKELTLFLTKAGAKAKGDRDINVEIDVHNASSSDPDYQNVPTKTVAVAVSVPDEAPVFDRAQLGRVAVVGTSREIGIETARDSERDEITYSLANNPAWISQKAGSPRVLVVGTNAVPGLYTITIVASDANNSVEQLLSLDVIPAPSLAKWKLADGKPSFEIATDACKSIKRWGTTGYNGIVGKSIDSRYSGAAHGDVRRIRMVRLALDRDACGTTLTRSQTLGSGGSSADVDYSLADDKASIMVDDALVLGSHSYKIDYGLDERLIILGSAFVEDLYNKAFNVKYVLSAATVTVAEVAASTAAIGHKVGTVVLDSADAVTDAIWSVEGTPAFAVGVGGLADMATTKGVLSLTTARAMNFEDGEKFLTVTVNAVTPDTASSLVQARTELVIELEDLDEPPAFPGTGELSYQSRSNNGSDTFTIPEATDPESETITYTAVEDGETDLPTGVQQVGRVFTIGSSAVLGTYTIAVTATDENRSGANALSNESAMSITKLFVLDIATNTSPVFESASLTGSVSEEQEIAAGTSLGTLEASDSENDVITYGITTSGDSALDLFRVNTTSGVISLVDKQVFDRETKATYTITVTASDGTRSTQEEFVLSIDNVPELPVVALGVFAKVLVAGTAQMNVEVVSATDPDDTPGDVSPITYTVASLPAWMTQTAAGSNLFNLSASDSHAGLHTVTVQIADDNGGSVESEVQFIIYSEPSLSKWHLADGKPVIELASDLCEIKAAVPFAAWGLMEITLTHKDGSKDGYDTLEDCPTTETFHLDIGAGGTSVPIKLELASGKVGMEIGSVLAPGEHSYRVDYNFSEIDKSTTDFLVAHTSTYMLSYLVSEATVTIAETTDMDAASGKVVATATLLGSGVSGATWSVLGTPVVPVGVSAVSGSEATEGEVALTQAAAIDYEDGAEWLTVTIQAVTPDSAANLVQGLVELAIHLEDADDSPYFASAFPDQQVSNMQAAMFTVPAAQDHESDALTHSASLINPAATLPAKGVSFNPTTREFTIAANAPVGTVTVAVKAVQTGDSSKSVTDEFVIVIAEAGIDVGSSSGLDKTTVTEELPVKLLGQPAGGANVTLTITSADAADVAVHPDHMVFTSSNWNTAQNLTLSLTDAGVTVKGMRDVAIGLAVHDASSSAANYQSVAAVNFNVAVDVTNASPEFAFAQRTHYHAEHVGSATAAIGDAVATVRATDDDNPDLTDLTYSINPASALFTIDSATGQLAHKAATNFDHEASTNSYTVTVEVHDGEDPSIRGTAKVTVVIVITDVNEPPVLPALEDQTVIAGVGGRYQFPAATDPDAGDDATIAYTSVFVGTGCPGCMRFVDSTRTFVFPQSLTTVQDLTIRVMATSNGNLSDSEDFVLRVREGGSIDADVSSAAALSRTNRTELIAVKLDLEPKSQGVTLTLESLDSADVAAGPATMEFSKGNWNVAQNLTVSLTEAGVARKGSRVVNVSVGVHMKAGSDEYYQGSDAQTIAVQVANANAATEFNLPVISAIELTLDESVGSDPRASAVDVGGAPIAASDDDNTDLTYRLLEGDDEFEIASDGQLSAKTGVNFNHERQPVHEVVVVATDGEAAAPGVVPGVATVTVMVQINDVDEKPGDYTGHGLASRGETRNEITLGWSNSEYEAQFDAVDRASIVVSFGGGGYKGTVELAADATQVRLVGLVPGVSYAVSLHWYSADGIPQDTAAEPGAAVMTGANMVPVLDELTYTRSEDAGLATTAAGTAVATVSATDGDGDEVMYSIQGGADAAKFVIDAQSGVVRLAETLNLDREQQDSYTFEVAATDIYGASMTDDLTLNIADVPEDPVLPVQYAQTAQEGEGLIITLRAATNPQDMSASIEYSAELEGGGELPDFIEVDAMKGQLTVATSAPTGTWRVVVRAMVSSGGSTSTGLPAAFTEPTIASERIFELSVVPAANSAPSFGSATKSFNLEENSEFAAGHSVGTVAATDADASDTLVYSLRGEDAAPFAIGAGGVLTLKDAMEFDTESKESWTFVVDVNDGNNGLASTEVVVMIDGVDEAPVFLSAQPAYRVVGRTESDFVVQPAVDPESDSISYDFSSPGAWLTLDDSDPLALVFTVAAGAPVGVHPVTLTATAGIETAEHEFDIEVQTAGNREPQFASALAQFEIETETAVAAATQIGDVVATDADSHALSYRIVSGDDAALFAIDATSGQIEVAAGQQLAAGATYRFTVEVSDGNGGVSQVQVAVEVAVEEAQAAVPDAGSQQQDEVAAVVMDRALALAAVDMLQARINAPAASPGGLALGQEASGDEPLYMRMASATDQWSGWRQDHESDDDRIERMQWRDFVYSRGFDLALDSSGRRRPRMRLWGSGSRSTLDGAPVEDGAQVAYDGSAKLFMVGVEHGLSWARLGIALGQSDAELSLGQAAEARAERDLKVVHPYVSFQLSDRMRAWAVGGYGRGDYVKVDTSGAEDVRTVRDSGYTSFAGGFESSWDAAPAEFSAGFKALLVKSRLDEVAAQPVVNGTFWRGEADFRAARRFDLQPDLWLRPFVGLHLHHDGGEDWLDSSYLDTTAGMSLAWSGGLRFEFSSRWQINDGDVNDERLEASIDYDFGGDGRGLMLSASPSMASSSDAPWSRSLGARVGYGLPVQLLSDRGIATVSAEFSGSQESLSSHYGFSFAGRRLDVDLSAGGDSYRLGLRLR